MNEEHPNPAKAEADRLLQQGQQQLNQNQAEIAQQSFQQALTIYQQILDRQGEGITLGHLGIAYYQSEDYLKAVESLQQGLTIARSIVDCKLEVMTLVYLGQTYSSCEEYAKAIKYYQQALAIARELNNRCGEGAVAGGLALAYETLRDYEPAANYYQLMLTVAEEFQDSETAAVARTSLKRVQQIVANQAQVNQLLQQGIEQMNSSQPEVAQQTFQEALTLAQESLNFQGQWQALNNLGTNYQTFCNFPRAIETFEQQLALSKVLNDSFHLVLALLNLGEVHLLQGDYIKAIEYEQLSLEIVQNLNNGQFQDKVVELEKLALAQLAVAYEASGNFQKAIECHKQNLEIAQSLDDRLRAAEALINLGSIYRNQDKYVEAIDCFKQCLDNNIDNLLLQVRCLCNLTINYLGLGEFAKVIKYAKQTLSTIENPATKEQILSPVERTYLEQLKGQVLSVLKSADLMGFLNSHQSIETFEQDLEWAKNTQNRSEEATAEANLGNVYSILGNYDQAIQHYQKALEIHQSIDDPKFKQLNRQIEGLYWGFLARAYASKGYTDTAIKYAQNSLQIAQEDPSHFGQAQALVNLGRTLFLAGQLSEASKTLKDAIDEFEFVRQKLGAEDAYKVSFFDLYTDTYELLQQVLIAQNRCLDALEIAEAGRARSFAELLVTRLSPSAQGNSKFVPKSPPTIAQIQQIPREQNATLVAYSIIYDNSQIVLPGRIKGLQASLEAKLFIWAVKPTGEIAFRQVDLKPFNQQNISLSKLVTQVRESLGVKEETLRDATPTTTQETPQPIRYINELLRQLHQYLIEPIAHHLPTDPNAHVIFIPQGSLFLVPFPALQDATGKFLIEQHTILTAPSIQVLELTRKQRQRVEKIHELPLQSQNALVVGNPTMPTIPLKEPPQPLNPLPGSEAEAKAIASLLNTQAIIGDKATKIDIVQQMPKARLIHLATHGLLDDIKQLGVPGAIALAPSDNDNGFLTAGEILEMKLNAELIVLSACSSGQGKITGDGVIGLSRSLFAAGVPSAIVSLWSVGDDSTEFLMTEFYQNLQNGMNKAQALRQAILKTREDFSDDPYSWAAFTLIGEAE
jgi:CHAT domain-containing protein/Tfp pilus assembly protein PilF